MASETAAQLAAGIRAALAELESVCAGVTEDVAGRAPAGRWSPKEILSHLAGPEEGGPKLFEAFVTEDTPRLDLAPERTHFSEARRAMSFAELTRLMARRFDGLAAYVAGLDEAQLARRAFVPVFKNSPLTDHPTLAAFLGKLGRDHVRMHADHLRQVLAELAAN